MTLPINELLRIDEEFSDEHYSVFCPTKSVCLVVPPKGCKLVSAPNVYLRGKIPGYVDSFRYLGHWINSEFTDDEDIKR